MNSMKDALHFTECGLDNVYLMNGFRYGQTSNGEEVLIIQDLPGLHAAIAMSVVDSPEPLNAKTFKYLRKQVDMAQRQLAGILGVEEGTVSLWERGKQPVPKSADIILRLMVRETCNGNARLVELIERFNALDRVVHENMLQLQIENDHWQACA
ncbi:transcriptional regulator [Lysobacteraceae bacterium NML95-0200]|nr:transcriptional regulator [Xanthomonadaceae bacterium NML95-0200]